MMWWEFNMQLNFLASLGSILVSHNDKGIFLVMAATVWPGDNVMN